jgi:glycosyltransferase involved in cell wall biosynthesis
MNIVVFDVAAEYGGAVTILKQYYDLAKNDKGNNWYFVISTPALIDSNNVKILRYTWVKKSWFHRLYFDRFVAQKIAEQYKADEVMSLQNLVVRGIKVKQTLYLHQPLPFVEKRYRLTENFKFWVYQNIMSRMIFNSVRKADSIIVQTNWMKEACVRKIKVAPSKFKVIRPSVNIKIKKSYQQDDELNKLFFYPADPLSYKNHTIIVEVAKLLKKKGLHNFRVVFTLAGNETRNVVKMYHEVQENNLPIEFLGKISLDEVYDYYSKSILIFPSYIETFGLPLLEAKMHGSPILASDCAFSHEILDGYDKVKFFDPFNCEELASLVETTLA